MRWLLWFARGPPGAIACQCAIATRLRRPEPCSPVRDAWDGNDRQLRPALLPFSSEVTPMSDGTFFLSIVLLSPLGVVWGRDER